MDELLEKLWQQYVRITPMALEIKNKLDKKENRNIINDHIAIRTLNNSKINITLAKIFEQHGYFRCKYYDFKEKKLNAYHYEHKNSHYPKIFISELRVEELSETSQSIAQMMTHNIPLLNSEDLLLSGRHWEICHKVYEELYQESEYLAWFYVFGFVVNHFTILVNDTKFKSVKHLNTWLENEGYVLNSSGGKVKGSPEVLLEQSSIMAQKIIIQFIDGKFEVPSCYYEFAKRYKNNSGKLYTGFIASSADKIFESTNR